MLLTCHTSSNWALYGPRPLKPDKGRASSLLKGDDATASKKTNKFRSSDSATSNTHIDPEADIWLSVGLCDQPGKMVHITTNGPDQALASPKKDGIIFLSMQNQRDNKNTNRSSTDTEALVRHCASVGEFVCTCAVAPVRVCARTVIRCAGCCGHDSCTVRKAIETFNTCMVNPWTWPRSRPLSLSYKPRGVCSSSAASQVCGRNKASRHHTTLGIMTFRPQVTTDVPLLVLSYSEAPAHWSLDVFTWTYGCIIVRNVPLCSLMKI